jgi:hypothetical protein
MSAVTLLSDPFTGKRQQVAVDQVGQTGASGIVLVKELNRNGSCTTISKHRRKNFR